MEIEINEIVPQSPRQYPYLGIATKNRDLVMFTQKDTGLLIKEGILPDRYGSEFAILFWNEVDFKPFQGTLVIK